MHSYSSRKARGPHLRFTEGAGLGLPIIGKLLGHAQASTTARYAHLDAETLRLPAFPRETGPILAWPPPPAPVLVSSFVLPGPGPDWHAELRVRDAARHEESLRVIAHYEAQRREREEREFKEGREATAREVAERNRRNGWPY
jgi:hypothetical protein